MAKKNVRDEPSKTQVTENPQMSDIVLVLDKMKLLIQAVSEINKNGKYSTVPADKEHQNSFLKIDRYATFFENFLKNFWNQLKDPTHFGLFTIKEEEFDKPEVKQAIEDLAEGKKTKAVEEFLKKYEITPKNQTEQSINNQNLESMAKKNQTQQPVVEANDQQQNNQYRYNESMINWDQLKNFGLSREYLQERGHLDSMLKGYKTNQLVPINLNFGSAVLRTDARLSLQQSNTGEVVLAIHGIRMQPELERPYFGHIFSEEDKKNLLETGNMGRVVELKGRNGEYIPSFISLDKMTNEVVAMRAENVYIPNEIKGVQLTDQEKNDLREGKKVYIEGMTAKSGNEFNAHIQVSAERRGIDFIFENDRIFNRTALGGVELTKQQIEDLNAGKAIFVEDMQRKDGELFSSYVKLDEATGRPNYTRYNPDSPEGAREIYIPKEIGGVKLTGSWEKTLLQIEQHTLETRSFMHSIESFTSQVTREVLGLKFPAPKQRTLPCPKCSTGKVMIRPKVAKCDNPDCGLLVFRKVLNKELNEQHLEQLLSSGATKVIKGFKGKKGNSFDAAVAFDDEFNVTLAFPDKKRGKKR